MTVGIINVLKPPGMTSHDVVAFIRRVYGLKKVGHAGTLDPAAAGVLPIFLGKATRLIEYTSDGDKAYRAELTLGYATDSGDDTGHIIHQKPVPVPPTASEVEAVFKALTGPSEQVPPMYSAIKIDGKRLYQLAREGLEIERQPRTIMIKQLALVALKDNVILFDVLCSKGTYIRTLCLDIGQQLGYPAVMSFLVRTAVGNLLLGDAVTLEEIANTPQEVLLPLDFAMDHLPLVTLSPPEIADFCQGKTVACAGEISATIYRIYDDQSKFMGIGKKSDNIPQITPIKVLCGH